MSFFAALYHLESRGSDSKFLHRLSLRSLPLGFHQVVNGGPDWLDGANGLRAIDPNDDVGHAAAHPTCLSSQFQLAQMAPSMDSVAMACRNANATFCPARRQSYLYPPHRRPGQALICRSSLARLLCFGRCCTPAGVGALASTNQSARACRESLYQISGKYPHRHAHLTLQTCKMQPSR